MDKLRPQRPKRQRTILGSWYILCTVAALYTSSMSGVSKTSFTSSRLLPQKRGNSPGPVPARQAQRRRRESVTRVRLSLGRLGASAPARPHERAWAGHARLQS